MSEHSRRIGSKAQHSSATSSRMSGAPASVMRVKTGAIALHVMLGLIALPVLSGLLRVNALIIIGSIGAFAAMAFAARTMRRGLLAEQDYAARLVAKAPTPFKNAAHALVALSVFLLAFVADGMSIWLSAIYAALALLGSVLAYGMDPRADKRVDPDLAARAGIDTETVIAALNEASTKIAQIEREAMEIENRELTERLRRITASGRRVLDRIEQDPSDIRRARRFLVTYLDGTLDIVTKYRSRQSDLANTPLGDSFRHVLETVETVFIQQEDVLSKNETLDLEVQIEVLRTQMEREGVS